MQEEERLDGDENDQIINANDSIMSLSDLSRRMHCPINYRAVLPNLDHADESLTHIPWKFGIEKQTDEIVNQGAIKPDNSSSPQAITNNKPFPSCSFLDLRRQQNSAWASERHKEGMKLIFINPIQAESKFLEGLDLVPDHVDLLVDYGRLLISNKRWEFAEARLKRAIALDPDHKQAKESLDRLQQSNLRRSQQLEIVSRNKKLTVGRESSVYNDVLMERSLLMGDTIDNDADEASDILQQNSRKRSKRTRKHKKSKKRKRKRRRYYSSSSSDSSGYMASSLLNSPKEADGEEEQPSRVPNRKKRRKRRHRSSPSASSDPSSYLSSDSDTGDRVKEGEDKGGENTTSDAEETRRRRKTQKDRSEREEGKEDGGVDVASDEESRRRRKDRSDREEDKDEDGEDNISDAKESRRTQNRRNYRKSRKRYDRKYDSKKKKRKRRY
jgi:hypothetical protein